MQMDDGAIQIIRQSLSDGLSVRQATIDGLIPDILDSANLLIRTFQSGHKVLIFGNGGSAATAQHLAGELVGRYKVERSPLPALALTADSSVLTCIGNDYAFAEVFARQVQALTGPGDLVIGITTSGHSANVLRGLGAARLQGAHTLALTGQAGLAEPLADTVLAAPSLVTARIQEEHDAIIHAWCEVIDRVFSRSDEYA
jgi:D-sedoheptulose 7-phosphate isomerase